MIAAKTRFHNNLCYVQHTRWLQIKNQQRGRKIDGEKKTNTKQNKK